MTGDTARRPPPLTTTQWSCVRRSRYLRPSPTNEWTVMSRRSSRTRALNANLISYNGFVSTNECLIVESKQSLRNVPKSSSYMSFEMHSRPDSSFGRTGSRHELRESGTGAKKLRKKLISSPTHSLEDFTTETTSRRSRTGDSLRAPKIRRNPSWPAVMISPNSTSSSEYEENRSLKQTTSGQKLAKKSTYLTTKVKKLHKRRLKSRSRPQLESSLSVNSCPISSDNRLSARSANSWFHSSSRSSSTESFLSSANDDETTIISQIRPKKKHNSSQSLCYEPSVCDIFNAGADYPDSAQLHPKQAIASISDTALHKANNSSSLETSSSSSRRRSKRTIHKQKAMQEDDHIFDSFLDKQVLLERS
ncbi:unnamed protein product [Oppiella nova]|uniref:Uncharacterized protein n=1 Tax=Oppiella nova TaxID=334625 RepID=A0A7R9MAL2_9ACAR|nr:unnamed protein product [Oppiella nova]CAG2173340.1 unnamed protein product [Oppiella nova]